MMMDEIQMLAVAKETLSIPRDRPYTEKEQDRVMRGFFGVPIPVMTNLWNRLEPTVNFQSGALPKHLLWSLLFLKLYSTEEVHCALVGWPTRKTFRKWSWFFLSQIDSVLYVDVIRLENRFFGYDGASNCLISVDGTHCPINEPWPFEKKWYSHKFNGPAVSYEVAVCIKTGFIVWINGPFPASVNDAVIFKKDLSGLLAEDEAVEADAGYKGDDKLKNPQTSKSRNERLQKSGVRGRHENVNSRLKIFNLLNIPFRHLKPRDDMMNKHKICFNAIVVLTQLKFESGESLYEVQYDVEYF